MRWQENGGLIGWGDGWTIAGVAGELLEHPELRALRNFGVAEEQIQGFQVLFLPENLTTTSCGEELIDAGDAAETGNQLGRTRAALDRANWLVHEAARQMIPFAHIPTERHILYPFNDGIPSHETTREYLAEVIAIRRAKTSSK